MWGQTLAKTTGEVEAKRGFGFTSRRGRVESGLPGSCGRWCWPGTSGAAAPVVKRRNTHAMPGRKLGGHQLVDIELFKKQWPLLMGESLR